MLLITLAGLVSAGAAPAAPAARAPLSVDDLKVVYESASDVVQFQIESVQANPTAAPRLVWEVRGPVLETFKGRLLPGSISVHVESIVRSFDLPRADLEGRQVVVAIKPRSEQADRRVQLVCNGGFAA